MIVEMKIAILGILQGITEFLPISSSGHLVLFGHFLNFTKDDIVMEVILHFGTLGSILIFFRKDIVNLLNGIFHRQRDSLNYGVYILVATIPIVVFSLSIREYIETIFSVNVLIYTYIVNAVILFATRQSVTRKQKISLQLAIIMGCSQVFALFPGISRAGITICTGLLLGHSRKEVAKFSFFMAIPALVGAIVFELDNIMIYLHQDMSNLIIGLLVSLVTGLFALRLLFKILQSNKLWVFSYYCIAIWLLIIYIL